MDFLDNLGKKLTNAGQSAAQKTKDVADIAKLTAEVSTEERKLNDCYVAIGKLYVSLHHDDYESEFEKYFKFVKVYEGKIEECKQQIKDIKGIVTCEKCGADIPVGSLFCGKCGAPVPQSNTEEVEESKTTEKSSEEVTEEKEPERVEAEVVEEPGKNAEDWL